MSVLKMDTDSENDDSISDGSEVEFHTIVWNPSGDVLVSSSCKAWQIVGMLLMDCDDGTIGTILTFK